MKPEDRSRFLIALAKYLGVRPLPADPLSSIRLSEEWHLDECLKLIIVDSGRVVLPIARFNELMLHCGRPLVSPWFFDYFFRAIETIDQFETAVERFRIAAMWLYGNFKFAHRALGTCGEQELTSLIHRTEPRPPEPGRQAFTEIEDIADDELPMLGYISSGRVKAIAGIVTEVERMVADSSLRRLIGNEPRVLERLEVHSISALGLRLHRAQLGPVQLAMSDDVNTLLREAAAAAGDHKLSALFLGTEWEQVVDAWQLDSWEAYRDVQRLGRRTRLPEARRAALWMIFERVRAGLRNRGLITEATVFQALADTQDQRPPAFDAAVVDEAQDVSLAQLRFLAALGGARPNALFFAGDLGQRIFQQPFSWKTLGVDVRGRSKTLRVNYRTSHQIRTQADRLLGPELTDVDGNHEDRRHTVSTFNGPPPQVRAFQSERDESEAIGAWLRSLGDEGIKAHEIGVFVRSAAELSRATAAVTAASLPIRILDDRVETKPGQLNVATMHLAKGLEFRAVAVMACDDEILPLQARIENVGDDGDLQEVYDTERQLLYVACTRARDRLSISGVEPASEFLDDLIASR